MFCFFEAMHLSVVMTVWIWASRNFTKGIRERNYQGPSGHISTRPLATIASLPSFWGLGVQVRLRRESYESSKVPVSRVYDSETKLRARTSCS